jgi:hypothetical protein
MLKRYIVLPAALALLVGMSAAQSQTRAESPKISDRTRMDLVRALNAEFVFARKTFPMGEKGLRLKDGVVTPDDAEVRQMIAAYGPAVRPGDRAQITNVLFKDRSIIFEINGGPRKKKRWYERLEVGGSGGSKPVAQADPATLNARGSYVELMFDKHVPEIDSEHLKKLLDPVFNFRAVSAVEAYMESIPPKARTAIQNHQVLVGMNREMVQYAKGRAPKKYREHDGKLDYEEWIYGEPPNDVEFVRFVGDEVVRVVTMKVDGEKLVRSEKEIDLAPQKPVVAEQKPQQRPPSAPTLRRPGDPEAGQAPASGTPLPPPRQDSGEPPIPRGTPEGVPR